MEEVEHRAQQNSWVAWKDRCKKKHAVQFLELAKDRLVECVS